MDIVLNLVWLIPLFPLLATAIITFVQPVYRNKKLSARLTIAMMALSLVLATLVLVGTLTHEATVSRLMPLESPTHEIVPVEEPAGTTEPTAEAPAEGEAEATAEGGQGEEAFIPPEPIVHVSFHWMQVGVADSSDPYQGHSLTLGFWVDPLVAAMLFMVTLVGLCIFVYSQGYMAAEDFHGEDPRYSRFFSFMGLFAFSMLGLVIADSILLLFICWELVGLCSYLLIGFWNYKKSAYDAAIKAFIVTKIGDAGFFIGIFLLYIYTGNMNIGDLIHNPAMLANLASTHLPEAWPIIGGASIASVAAISLFIGTMGKSAQVPLHVWLPDAMEGPTPVSALIHAATMVAAGVFMVVRMFPLFLAAGSGTLTFVGWVGGITALLAATIAVAQDDIKRVLAYSTISQLGYMVMALGVMGYVAGFFHLLTHAFFKAMLFLGSGAVIIGAHHVQDMREMGGLAKRLPKTFWTYLIGALALAGIAPMAGFFSKDEILLDAFNNNPALYVIGTLAAFLTAFYMTRQMFMVFAGKPRSHGAAIAAEVPLLSRDLAAEAQAEPMHVEAGHAVPEAHGGPHGAHAAVPSGEHVHHVGPLPLNMTVPLIVLAIFTALMGLIVGLPLDLLGLGAGTFFSRFVGGHAAFSILVATISTLVALAGVAVGYWIYGRNLMQTAHDPDPLEAMMRKVHLFDLRLGPDVIPVHLGWLFQLWRKKYYFDEIYGFIFVQGTHLLARVSYWFDRTVPDGLVNGVARLVRMISDAFRWFDLNVVDGLVNLVGWFGRAFSALQGWIDLHIVDGLVNFIALFTGWWGRQLRRFQTGKIQDYLMYVVLGVLVIGGLVVVMRLWM
jgi:NADH-quinone oxidoreductase subunit L